MNGGGWTRRQLLLAGGAAGAAGLGLAVWLRRPDFPSAFPNPSNSYSPDALLRIGTDGTITLLTCQSEIGQGIHTALAIIVCEALDAAWDRMRVEQAPVLPAFANPLIGSQLTVASLSVRSWYGPLRTAAGRARAMLIAAAAARWGVDADECETSHGTVVHRGSNREANYGDLAADAGNLSPRAVSPSISPRRRVDARVRRLGGAELVNGAATYGADVRIPEMLVAALARPPRPGARIAHLDAAPALAHRDVVRVERMGESVAVMARGSWGAIAGRQSLGLRWTGGETQLASATIRARYHALLDKQGRLVSRRGRAPDAGDRSPVRGIMADFWFPLLAHAALEPLTCTARVRDKYCEIWLPTQAPTRSREAAAQAAGLAPEQVTVHVTACGGGFGRRAQTDMVTEAVALSKVTGVPVQLLWTREDDTRHDFYRPCSAHRISASIDARGRIEKWQHWIAGDGSDGSLPPYDIARLRVWHTPADPGVPIGIWRGVDHVSNAFVVETTVDELAVLAMRDPLEFRLNALPAESRLARALRAARDMRAWPGKGSAGLAVHEMADSIVATIATVKQENGEIRVLSVRCFVDCGTVVSEDGVRAQIEGGVAFGLSAALFGRITIDQGAVVEGNFDSYRVLRMPEMPKVEVVVLRSDAPPGGVGEIVVPTVAPAIANAMFQLTGTRTRVLPLVPGVS